MRVGSCCIRGGHPWMNVLCQTAKSTASTFSTWAEVFARSLSFKAALLGRTGLTALRMVAQEAAQVREEPCARSCVGAPSKVAGRSRCTISACILRRSTASTIDRVERGSGSLHRPWVLALNGLLGGPGAAQCLGLGCCIRAIGYRRPLSEPSPQGQQRRSRTGRTPGLRGAGQQ